MNDRHLVNCRTIEPISQICASPEKPSFPSLPSSLCARAPFLMSRSHFTIKHTVRELGGRVRIFLAEIEHFERGSMPLQQKILDILEAIAEETVDALRRHTHGDDVCRDISQIQIKSSILLALVALPCEPQAQHTSDYKCFMRAHTCKHSHLQIRHSFSTG